MGYNEDMGILDNFENAWDDIPEGQFENLSQKLFSETCCSDCSCKTNSTHIQDDMGREVFWEDLGRP